MQNDQAQTLRMIISGLYKDRPNRIHLTFLTFSLRKYPIRTIVVHQQRAIYTVLHGETKPDDKRLNIHDVHCFVYYMNPELYSSKLRVRV